MFDLFDEFKALIDTLEKCGVDYALCGGLAMAVYGFYRTTIDIDLLIRGDALQEIKSAVKGLGYTIEAQPMEFAKGAVEIHRVSKLDADSEDTLSLDLLLVTPQIESVWQSRSKADWEGGQIKVVSREGLITMKSLRNNQQDIADIEKLEEVEDES